MSHSCSLADFSAAFATKMVNVGCKKKQSWVERGCDQADIMEEMDLDDWRDDNIAGFFLLRTLKFKKPKAGS